MRFYLCVAPRWNGQSPSDLVLSPKRALARSISRESGQIEGDSLTRSQVYDFWAAKNLSRMAFAMTSVSFRAGRGCVSIWPLKGKTSPASVSRV